MAEKTFGRVWTRKNTLGSVVLFLVHFVIWVLIAAGFLLGDKLSYIAD